MPTVNFGFKDPRTGFHGFWNALLLQIRALTSSKAICSSPGVPTATSAPAHKNSVVQSGDDIFVWPSLKGKVRGQVIMPFYPKLAEALGDLNDRSVFVGGAI